MPQTTDDTGHFALEGTNYGLPHHGFPIHFLEVFHLENPLVVLDLIFTLRGLPTKDAILRHIDKASVLASSILCNNWLIVHPQQQCTQGRK